MTTFKRVFLQSPPKNKLEKAKAADKQKAKPRFYGEALTLDKMYERVSEEQQQKEVAASSKTNGKSKGSKTTKSKASSKCTVVTKSGSPKYKRTGRY